MKIYVVYFDGKKEEWKGLGYPERNENFFFAKGEESAAKVAELIMAGERGMAYEAAQRSLVCGKVK